MIRAPHLVADTPAAAPLPKGAPRPWWEGRPFVAAMILLAFLPLTLVTVGGLLGLLAGCGVAAGSSPQLVSRPTPTRARLPCRK